MFNPMDLSGKRILVTGASSGIGRETAVLLSRLGASIILVARRADALAETLRMLDGEKHRVAPFDLMTTAEIPRWMKQIAMEDEPLNGLVHSAGVHEMRPLQVLTPEVLESSMRIHVGAAAALLRGFRQRGVVHSEGGSVVLLSSVMGLVGQPGVSAYAACKGAMIALGRALALELAEHRIRVNCIAPGQVQSEMLEKQQQTLTVEQMKAIEASHPLGIGTARDVANAVAFLLADTGRWITGTAMVVDGGYTAH